MMFRRFSKLMGDGPFRLALCVGLAATCVTIGWGQTLPETPVTKVEPPSTQQIALWVEQLDDDQFVIRTNATDKLIMAGAPAVEPVAKAVVGGNLEVSTRAVYVLRELAVGLDIEAQERALEALEKLAEARQRSAARLAKEAILALGEVRQRQTIDQLVQLGASVIGNQRIGFTPVPRLEVEIGPDWRGSLKDLQRLEWMRDLYKITFVGPQVTDAWVEMIRENSNLNYVAIKNAQITDNAMRIISGLKSVVYIDVMYTPISNTGFECLRDMKSLRQVRCFGTLVSRETADRFQADFADIIVQHKNGAFLGVRCQQPPWPCVVQLVTDKSAADKGGVKNGDIIVSYNKQPVANFEDLQRLIAQNQVGDTVEIQVVRGGKPVYAKVSRQPLQKLGLEGEATSLGLKVTKASAEGAATKAGVQAGDLIVALDVDRVLSLDELQKAYEKNVPNPDAVIQLLRNVKKESMKVTFGEWTE